MAKFCSFCPPATQNHPHTPPIPCCCLLKPGGKRSRPDQPPRLLRKKQEVLYDRGDKLFRFSQDTEDSEREVVLREALKEDEIKRSL